MLIRRTAINTSKQSRARFRRVGLKVGTRRLSEKDGEVLFCRLNCCDSNCNTSFVLCMLADNLDGYPFMLVTASTSHLSGNKADMFFWNEQYFTHLWNNSTEIAGGELHAFMTRKLVILKICFFSRPLYHGGSALGPAFSTPRTSV